MPLANRPPARRHAPRVLFLSPDLEDYLADGVLHGLRALLGANVVDYPKHEILYETCPAETQRLIRGNGFTLYGRLADIPINRARVVEQARAGDFDAVIFSAIHQNWGKFLELAPFLTRNATLMVFLDGGDHEAMYPYAGALVRRPSLWFVPRAHRRGVYFKREFTPLTASYRTLRLLPPSVAARLGLLRSVHPTSFAIPDDYVVRELPAKTQLLARHVVDPDVARAIAGSNLAGPPGEAGNYAFNSESAYVHDLRCSRFAVTGKRGGWDALRHYEIAANACVPCFRDLTDKPAACAPHGLDESNCIPYRSAEELLEKVVNMSDDAYRLLQAGALDWARANTATARAAAVLEVTGLR